MPKILLTQVTEPQRCFPLPDGATLCNWVKQGIYAISSKNGWIKIPPPDSQDENTDSVNDKTPTAKNEGVSSVN